MQYQEVWFILHLAYTQSKLLKYIIILIFLVATGCCACNRPTQCSSHLKALPTSDYLGQGVFCQSEAEQSPSEWLTTPEALLCSAGTRMSLTEKSS